jgi:hypothetical protein
LITIGAVQDRAGESRKALASFREALAVTQDTSAHALAHCWMAITSVHQRRRALAKDYFAQADRYVRAQLKGTRPNFEPGPQSILVDSHWCRLLLAWREAQARVMDEAFPGQPFAR